MSEIEHGGPAFPISLPGFGDNGASGMTLRDYFAAKAMQSWISVPSEIGGEGTNSSPDHASVIAGVAYEMADAMLAARGKS